jgi:hypothetical protein
MAQFKRAIELIELSQNVNNDSLQNLLTYDAANDKQEEETLKKL